MTWRVYCRNTSFVIPKNLICGISRYILQTTRELSCFFFVVVAVNLFFFYRSPCLDDYYFGRKLFICRQIILRFEPFSCMLPFITVKPCANHVSDGFREMCLLTVWVVSDVHFMAVCRWPLRRKRQWNKKISPIFSKHHIIASLVSLYPFKLNSFFLFNSLCSVCWKILHWLYVYCKYIKNTIFVFKTMVSDSLMIFSVLRS